MNAQQIKELRLKLGLTQSAFAYKMSTTVTTLSRWENGHSKPSPMAKKLLKRIAHP